MYFLRSFSVLGFISKASFERSIPREWDLRKSCGRPSSESIAEAGIVEVIDIAPETIIAVTTFRNKAVYVRIPLQYKNMKKTLRTCIFYVIIREHVI